MIAVAGNARRCETHHDRARRCRLVRVREVDGPGLGTDLAGNLLRIGERAAGHDHPFSVGDQPAGERGTGVTSPEHEPRR